MKSRLAKALACVLAVVSAVGIGSAYAQPSLKEPPRPNRGSPTAIVADPRQTGPASLVIGYRAKPGDKTALVQMIRASLAPRVWALRQTGALAHYHLLVSRYVDAAAWDALAVLDFRSPEDLARWKTVEAQHPAGLEAGGLEVVSSVETTVSDQVWSGTSSDARIQPVYLVIPYDYLISTSDYIAYADGYVLPQVRGWMTAGALESYGFYIARYGAGRAWSSLLLLAYRGDDGLGRRDAVVASTRRALASDPKWTSFASGKAQVRVEKAAMIADEVEGY